MYRFTVTANKTDHKPIVVFFCVLTLLLCLFLSSLEAIIFCIVVNFVAAILVWLKMQAVQPLEGVIILAPKQFRFENNTRLIQGEISAKSRLIGNSVWLYIKGFNNNYWLIITANSVDVQSYARLKRATLNAINAVELK